MKNPVYEILKRHHSRGYGNFNNLLVVLCFCLIFSSISAQPINDNWENAIEIELGADNFELGGFEGTPIDLTSATNQGGEYIQNPTFSKTIWYKFSLPTHRSVRIRILQPAEVLQSTDAGFFVYHSTASIPGQDDLATFTPMFSLASYSENVCLEPGEYYIQVVAKTQANSDVFADLLVESTYPVSSSEFGDNINTKQNLGTLGYNTNETFSWSCLSIESASEYPTGLGMDSTQYTKSMWFRFNTDDHIDLLSYNLSGANSGEDYYLRFYMGNIQLDDLAGAEVFYETANVIHNSSSINNADHLFCTFLPDTIYTVQIVGHFEFEGNSNFRMWHIGQGQVTGAYPQEADFNPLNEFGAIDPTPGAGTETIRFDFFSCEALLSNDSIQCGSVNLPDTIVYGNSQYDLTTWFTFSATADCNATFRAHQRVTQFCNSNYYNHYMRIRIFNQNTDNNCDSYNFPGDIYYDGVLNANGLVILNCMPEGEYAVQLLGKSRINSNPYSCSASQFGRRVTLAITLSSVPELEYGLSVPGDVDWINNGDALQTGVLNWADTAYFSCSKTVLPDTAICDNDMDRAIYREFIIGDSDADGLLDSGLVVIQNYNYNNNLLNQQVKSVFYKGDANQLAQDQGTFDWPEIFTGLSPFDGCNMFNTITYGYNNSNTYNIKKYCVTPGTYSLVSVGDSTDNGAMSRPNFRYTKSMQSMFADPLNPEDMGDIIAQDLSVTSQTDYFTCHDNPADVGGLSPCNGYTKQLYREFYLSQACRITVNEYSNNNPYNRMRLYRGRVSVDGLDGVVLAPYHSNSCYSGSNGSYFSLPTCATVPEGWYTVVSYGFGPNYENNHDFHETHLYSNYNRLYSIHESSYIVVNADTTELPGPFYNRPHKACVASDTISYNGNINDDYPSGGTSYTLCTERFKTTTDTPYDSIPIIGCSGTQRLSYFVFTTEEEYYLYIGGVPNFYKELYPLNALTDSLLFPTTQPIVTCDAEGNHIEVCRLPAGTYTLVVYGTNNQNCNTEFTPTIKVAPVGISRFDFAVNAYDFDLIPGDGTFYDGKVGDVHPTHPNRKPSHDAFYCTTGAFSDDPNVPCQGGMYDPIYPDTINNVYHNEPNAQTNHKRRNLWYTFVLQGKGTATVKINNHNGGSYSRPTFRVFRSNVNGELPFEDLLGLGQLDSTMAMGLTTITDNVTNWCSNGRQSEVSFSYLPDVCTPDTTKRRYYVVVDISEQYAGKPNRHMDLQVKWDPYTITPPEPKYDFYFQANVIGNGESDPPYTEVPLGFDQLYTGGWGNLSCATGDISDQEIFGTCNSANQKSLWWKFQIDEPGFLYVAVESDDTSPYSLTKRLLREVVPGDSIVSPGGVDGLNSLGQGVSSGPGGGVPNYAWRRHCISPGTYFYHVSRCAALDTSNVRVHAYLSDKTGDFCHNAISTSGADVGSYPVSVPVTCHTIGGDFGEDGSNMNCLLGPDGYQSTWFQFSYTGSESADILFQLNLNQLNNYVGPGDVRYRLFYGSDCSTMIEGQECSTNAYINNSIACVSASEGDFYVQVVYPGQATGTIGFTFTVSDNTNPDCNPFDPTNLTSDFYYQMNCTGDSVVFTNYASSGSSLHYIWDFGWNNVTSTEINPTFSYPGNGVYEVSLSVINPILGDTVTSTQMVDFEIGGSPLNLEDSLIICVGESTTLGQYIPFATYDWSTGESTAEIEVGDAGTYYLNVELNGCSYSDSTVVQVLDLSFDLGPDEQICHGDSIELGVLPLPEIDYIWSNGVEESSTYASDAATYWLQASKGNCIFTDSIDISVLDLSFNLGNDTTICLGESLPLYPTVADDVSFSWTTGASTDSISVASSGDYGLEISKDGCTSYDAINLNVFNLEVDLGADSILCAGSSIDLTPWTNAEVNYLWDNNSAASTLTINEPGIYALVVDSAGCFAADSIEISLLDLTFDLGNDTTICSGTSLLLDPETYPGVDYLWNTGSSNNSIIVESTGVYSLEVSLFHCAENAEISVDVLDLAFDLGNDTTICLGSSIDLQPNVHPGADYLWNTNSLEPDITTDTAGVFELTLSLMGCSASDEIQVDVFDVAADVPEEIETCFSQSAAVTVSGVDSISWQNGLDFIDEVSFLQFDFTPDVTQPFNWVAYENGCIENGTLQAVVIQPYIPEIEWPQNLCENDEDELVLEEPENTTGIFFYENEEVDVILPTDYAPGNYDLEYQYVDTNNCPWAIETEFIIYDTTLTYFTTEIVPICIDANPFDLSPLASHINTEYFVLYDDTNWVQTEQFEPGNITVINENPIDVPIRFIHINQHGCTSQLTDAIPVHPLPVVDIQVPDVCLNEPLHIVNESYVSGSNFSNTSWNFEGHPEMTEFSPQELWFPDQGTYSYTLFLESEIGCSITHVDTLSVFPVPQSDWIVNAYCANSPVEAEAQSVLDDGEIEAYHWWLPGEEIQTGNTFSHQFESWGTYPLSLSTISAFGCKDTLSGTVEVYPAPSGNIEVSDHCFGTPTSIGSIMDIPSGSIAHFSITPGNDTLWTDTTSGYYTFSTTGIQIIELSMESEMGCVTNLEDTLTVFPLPAPGFTLEKDSLCFGDSLWVQSMSSIPPPYNIELLLWEFSDGQSFTGSNSTIVPQVTGSLSLSLTAISNVGCVAIYEDTLAIEVMPVPEAGFAIDPNVVHISTPEVKIKDLSSGSTIWEYTTGDGTTYDTSSPNHLYESIGEYTIHQWVSSDFGCTDTASGKLTVHGYIVYIPNAFTPNEDGHNEIFKPSIFGERITEYEFAIFNRWGEQIFLSTDPDLGWNGSGEQSGSHYANTEVYTYYLRLKGENSFPEEYSGSVTLIR